MYQVIKRDGKISGFDIIKITDAIKKALDAMKGTGIAVPIRYRKMMKITIFHQ